MNNYTGIYLVHLLISKCLVVFGRYDTLKRSFLLDSLLGAMQINNHDSNFIFLNLTVSST